MSGYCPDCGNTICICDDVAKDKKNRNVSGRYIRRKEAADYLGISVRMLGNLQGSGKLKYYKLGHKTCVFKVSDLDDFVDRCEERGQE